MDHLRPIHIGMRAVLLLFFVFGLMIGKAQDLNFILEINEELITSKIFPARFSVVMKDGKKEDLEVVLLPGKITLPNETWVQIRSGSIKTITLSFGYYFYKKNKIQYSSYLVEMPKYLFSKEWLILKIYDFNQRKYQKRFGCHTEEEYFTVFLFEGSGIPVDCN